jgi:large subunit ribosomal protein L20
MPRVKRGTIKTKSRRNTLAQTKGYKFGRKSKKKMAETAIRKAGAHAFNDRRKKKGTMRRLWITRLNAALNLEGESYSKFIDKLKKKNIEIDRKILSEIAKDEPKTFKRIVDQVK